MLLEFVQREGPVCQGSCSHPYVTIGCDHCKWSAENAPSGCIEKEFISTKASRVAKRKWEAEQKEKGNLPKNQTPSQSVGTRAILLICSTLGMLLFGYRMYLRHSQSSIPAYVRFLLDMSTATCMEPSLRPKFSTSNHGPLHEKNACTTGCLETFMNSYELMQYIYTPEQLAKHGASSRSIWVGIAGEIYDVSSARNFYGANQDLCWSHIITLGYLLMLSKLCCQSLATTRCAIVRTWAMHAQSCDLVLDYLCHHNSDLCMTTWDMFWSCAIHFNHVCAGGDPAHGRMLHLFDPELSLECVDYLIEACLPFTTFARSSMWYAGAKGGYSFFAGTDASRAYLTGKFQDDLNDDVEDFTDEQFHGLMHWKDFYLKVLLLSCHGVPALHHQHCNVL